ncbi:MAG: hypothetical protein ACLFQK_09175 [Fibrobacterota bacterium]
MSGKILFTFTVIFSLLSCFEQLPPVSGEKEIPPVLRIDSLRIDYSEKPAPGIRLSWSESVSSDVSSYTVTIYRNGQVAYSGVSGGASSFMDDDASIWPLKGIDTVSYSLKSVHEGQESDLSKSSAIVICEKPGLDPDIYCNPLSFSWSFAGSEATTFRTGISRNDTVYWEDFSRVYFPGESREFSMSTDIPEGIDAEKNELTLWISAEGSNSGCRSIAAALIPCQTGNP